MTLLEFKGKLHSELHAFYPKSEIDSFYKLLLEHQLNFSVVDISLNPHVSIALKDLNFLLGAIQELKEEKPIQYILGETSFYGLPIKVNEHTLIPRQETEELVDWILKEVVPIRENEQLTILDIGTGSGCIAISLAKHLPKATMYALDISENALSMAHKNGDINNVSIHYKHVNILEVESVTEFVASTLKFDIIVSNPPYVRHEEKKKMSKNVLDYEPHQALFVENDNPLLFYDKIAELASKELSKNGTLFFEINQYLSDEMVKLLKEKNFQTIDVKKDLYDNFRMIKATL